MILQSVPKTTRDELVSDRIQHPHPLVPHLLSWRNPREADIAEESGRTSGPSQPSQLRHLWPFLVLLGCIFIMVFIINVMNCIDLLLKPPSSCWRLWLWPWSSSSLPLETNLDLIFGGLGPPRCFDLQPPDSQQPVREDFGSLPESVVPKDLTSPGRGVDLQPCLGWDLQPPDSFFRLYRLPGSCLNFHLFNLHPQLLVFFQYLIQDSLSFQLLSLSLGKSYHRSWEHSWWWTLHWPASADAVPLALETTAF